MVCPPIPCRPPLPLPRCIVPRSLPDPCLIDNPLDGNVISPFAQFASPLLKGDMLRESCAFPIGCVPRVTVAVVCPRSSPLASDSRQQTTLHHAPIAGPRHHRRSGDTIPKPARAHSAIRQSQARLQPAGAASDFFSSAPASAPSAAGSAFAGAAAAAPAGPAPRPAFKASS